MPNFDFTTTPRKGRDEVVHGGVSSGRKVASSVLTDKERDALAELVDAALRYLNKEAVDSTMTVSASLTSGSIVKFTCTL